MRFVTRKHTIIRGLNGRRSGDPAQTFHQSLIAPSLYGRWDAHGFAILGDRAASYVDALALEAIDELIVGEDVLGAFSVDQLLHAVANSFGRMGFAIGGGRNRGREEVLQLKDTAWRGDVLVGGHPRDSRFMHRY